MTKTLLMAPLLLFFAVLALGCKQGQTIVQTGDSRNNGITVSGSGKVVANPDVVLLQLGVQVLQPTVEAARSQAASSQQAVIDSLKSNGVQDKDIQTVGFSVQPQYDFSGRVQTLRGYQVTNVVSVKLRKVDNAGKAIDDAASAGGNDVVVRSISFTIDDPTELQARARAQAVDDARKRAEALAQSAGVSLGKPLSISETQNTPVFPAAAPSVARSADTTTPIQAGELEIVVNVTVVYSIQ